MESPIVSQDFNSFRQKDIRAPYRPGHGIGFWEEKSSVKKSNTRRVVLNTSNGYLMKPLKDPILEMCRTPSYPRDL